MQLNGGNRSRREKRNRIGRIDSKRCFNGIMQNMYNKTMDEWTFLFHLSGIAEALHENVVTDNIDGY